MATSFMVKIDKIGLFTFIRSPDISRRIALSPFWFNRFIRDDLATLFVNLVYFCLLTPKFTKVKDVHPVVSFFKMNLSDKLSQDPSNRFFTKFPPYGRYLIVNYVSGLHFFDRSRDVAMATNFKGKIGEINLYLLLFVALAFRNGLNYRYSDLKKFICDDLATLCVNLVEHWSRNSGRWHTSSFFP